MHCPFGAELFLITFSRIEALRYGGALQGVQQRRRTRSKAALRPPTCQRRRTSRGRRQRAAEQRRAAATARRPANAASLAHLPRRRWGRRCGEGLLRRGALSPRRPARRCACSEAHLPCHRPSPSTVLNSPEVLPRRSAVFLLEPLNLGWSFLFLVSINLLTLSEHHYE